MGRSGCWVAAQPRGPLEAEETGLRGRPDQPGLALPLTTAPKPSANPPTSPSKHGKCQACSLQPVSMQPPPPQVTAPTVSAGASLWVPLPPTAGSAIWSGWEGSEPRAKGEPGHVSSPKLNGSNSPGRHSQSSLWPPVPQLPACLSDSSLLPAAPPLSPSHTRAFRLRAPLTRWEGVQPRPLCPLIGVWEPCSRGPCSQRRG